MIFKLLIPRAFSKSEKSANHDLNGLFECNIVHNYNIHRVGVNASLLASRVMRYDNPIDSVTKVS